MLISVSHYYVCKRSRPIPLSVHLPSYINYQFSPAKTYYLLLHQNRTHLKHITPKHFINMSHDLVQSMQSGSLPRSSSEGPQFRGRFPPTSQQTPSDGLPGTQHWQAPPPMDQISVLQGQIAFLQKALSDEVHAHNQIRARSQYYRDATLQWERHYYGLQAQIRDQNEVTESLQRRVAELEAVKLVGRRMAEPTTRHLSVSMLNNPKESNQTVSNMTLTPLCSQFLTAVGCRIIRPQVHNDSLSSRPSIYPCAWQTKDAVRKRRD